MTTIHSSINNNTNSGSDTDSSSDEILITIKKIDLSDYQNDSMNSSNITETSHDFPRFCASVLDKKNPCRRRKCPYSHTLNELDAPKCFQQAACKKASCHYKHNGQSVHDYRRRNNMLADGPGRHCAHRIRVYTKQQVLEDVLIALHTGRHYIIFDIDPEQLQKDPEPPRRYFTEGQDKNQCIANDALKRVLPYKANTEMCKALISGDECTRRHCAYAHHLDDLQTPWCSCTSSNCRKKHPGQLYKTFMMRNYGTEFQQGWRFPAQVVCYTGQQVWQRLVTAQRRGEQCLWVHLRKSTTC